MHKKNRSIIFTLFCLLFVGVISAQEAFQCDELVREFISTMDETCPGMGRNEVCHGSTYAIAEFFDSELDHQGVFTRIGDIVSTSDIDRLYTAEYNPHIPQWGIALLKAQANIPNTLPGEIVTFILMGDTELSNSVEPDSQFESIARVPLRVERGVPAYYFPRVDSRVTIGVLAGAELFADARSSDNAWVRIVEDGVAGWIEISALDALWKSVV